jgi:hypothetical protein
MGHESSRLSTWMDETVASTGEAQYSSTVEEEHNDSLTGSVPGSVPGGVPGTESYVPHPVKALMFVHGVL